MIFVYDLWHLRVPVFGYFAIIIIITMNKLTDNDKRLIHIFRMFVQKSLLPQLRKFECSLAEWFSFSSLLSTDNINIGELQHFVDALPVWNTNKNDKVANFHRKSQTYSIDAETFNPNKTFGGERNKIGSFSTQADSSKQIQKQQSLKQRMAQNNTNILGNLERLLKDMQQSQSIIQNIAREVPRIDRGSSINNSTSSSNNNIMSVNQSQPQLPQSIPQSVYNNYSTAPNPSYMVPQNINTNSMPYMGGYPKSYF